MTSIGIRTNGVKAREAETLHDGNEGTHSHREGGVQNGGSPEHDS